MPYRLVAVCLFGSFIVVVVVVVVFAFVRATNTKKRDPKKKKVCERALLWALACQDLSFALRMCQHVDDEGMVLDHDVRDAVFRMVGFAIKQLPDTAVVNVGVGTASDAPQAPGVAAGAEAAGALEGEDAIGGNGGGEWKVEGTNATVEELWELDALLQRCVCVCVCVRVFCPSVFDRLVRADLVYKRADQSTSILHLVEKVCMTGLCTGDTENGAVAGSRVLLAWVMVVETKRMLS